MTNVKQLVLKIVQTISVYLIKLENLYVLVQDVMLDSLKMIVVHLALLIVKRKMDVILQKVNVLNVLMENLVIFVKKLVRKIV